LKDFIIRIIFFFSEDKDEKAQTSFSVKSKVVCVQVAHSPLNVAACCWCNHV